MNNCLTTLAAFIGFAVLLCGAFLGLGKLLLLTPYRRCGTCGKTRKIGNLCDCGVPVPP
jgi:hypothetical protein